MSREPGHLAWGLSPAKYSELQAELDDHLYCMQADKGIPAAQAARERLASPKIRRRLSGPHLTDQVYATLNRLPTHHEWLELALILLCFAVIASSDYLAWKTDIYEQNYYYGVITTLAKHEWMHITTWLLQGLGRAAFFATFTYSLWRAYRIGWGVLLARILQLKLIHTVLVVGTLAITGDFIWRSYFHEYTRLATMPAWLTAELILWVLVLLAAAVAAITRFRGWAFSLALLLAALFLVPGGPRKLHLVDYYYPQEYKVMSTADGGTEVVPATSIEGILDYTARYRGKWNSDIVRLKRDGWRYQHEWMRQPFHAFDLSFDPSKVPLIQLAQSSEHFAYGYSRIVPTGAIAVSLPLHAVGVGIAWLAAPIPLLGLVGLVGMVLIMGRRGPLEFIAYSATCILAIVATILPFMYGEQFCKLVVLGREAVIHSPFPQFEELLASPGTYNSASGLQLIAGLVLSAGVPWLLTGLFLKPSAAPPPEPREPLTA